MIYIPRRKRRLHGLPKVFLYSSTLLSFVGSYAAPVVNVVADTKALPDSDDSKNQLNPLLNQQANPTETTQQPQKVENNTNPKQNESDSPSEYKKTESKIQPQSEEPSIRPLASYTYQFKYINFVDNTFLGNGTATCDSPPGTTVPYASVAFQDLPTDSVVFGNDGRYFDLPNDPATPMEIKVKLSNMTFHITCVNSDGTPLKKPDGSVYPDSEVKFDKVLSFAQPVTNADLPNELKNYFYISRSFEYNQGAKGKGANQTIELKEKSQTVVKFKDMFTGQFLPNNTNITLWGNSGTVDISNRVPSGYILANSRFKDVTLGIPEVTVYVKKLVNTQVQFVDVSGNLIGPPQTISGPQNDTIVQNNIPIQPDHYGYRYVNNLFPNDITFKDGATARIIVEYDKNITNKIKFIDRNNPTDTFDNTQTTSGKYGDPVQLGSINLPSGYQIDDSMSAPRYVEDNGMIEIYIKKAIYTNTVDFTLNGVPTPLVRSQTITGHENENIPFNPSWIPMDYELNGTPPTLTIVANNGHHYTVDLKLKTPIPTNVSNTINYYDQNNTLIGSGYVITGLPGSTIPSSTLIAHIPNSHYELDPSQGDAIMGIDGAEIRVKTRAKSYNYNIVYKKSDGSVVSTVSVTGTYKTSAENTINDNKPRGYSLADITAVRNTIFGDDANIYVEVVEPIPITVKNKLNYKIDGTNLSIGTVEVGPESMGTAIPRSELEAKNPNSAHYELKASQGGLTYLADGTIQDVAVVPKSHNYNIVYKKSDGSVVSTVSVTGTYKTSAKNTIINNKPRGYKFVNTTDVNNALFEDSSTLNVIVTLNSVPTPPTPPRPTPPVPTPPSPSSVTNYIQFMVNGLYYGSKITVTRAPNSTIDLLSYLPNGFELASGVNKTITMGIDQKVHYIELKRKEVAPSPTPEPDFNFFQFLFGENYIGEKIKVIGNPGFKIDLRSILPDGYELQDGINPIATLGSSGTVNYIPVQKESMTNNVQFTVNGSNFGIVHKVNGKLGSSIDIASLIPDGYELSDKNKTYKIESDGTTHTIALNKKTFPAPDPVQITNYIQFTVDGLNFEAKKAVTGPLGAKIELASLIPDGYEVVNQNTSLTIGIDGITHNVAIKKIANPIPTAVDNFIQFTINGVNYSVNIKRTGQIGDPIDITPWIPSGYELQDKNTKLHFQANGTVHTVAIIKSTETPTTVTNYIQFTIDGITLGSPISVHGYSGKKIDVAALIPNGYVLVDPNASFSIKTDQTTQFIELTKVELTKLSTSHHPIETTIEPSTANLPQLGENKNNAMTLGMIGIAGAGAAAATKFMTSKKKKNTDN